MLLAPGVGELGEPLQGGFLGRRGVDGLEGRAILFQSWRAA
jgi:hypothetical protein